MTARQALESIIKFDAAELAEIDHRAGRFQNSEDSVHEIWTGLVHLVNKYQNRSAPAQRYCTIISFAGKGE